MPSYDLTGGLIMAKPHLSANRGRLRCLAASGHLVQPGKTLLCLKLVHHRSYGSSLGYDSCWLLSGCWAVRWPHNGCIQVDDHAGRGINIQTGHLLFVLKEMRHGTYQMYFLFLRVISLLYRMATGRQSLSCLGLGFALSGLPQLCYSCQHAYRRY
ncbi:hypothetical protein V8C44DRAFT_265924 [Trichoderma aethiopicum]